MRCSKCNFENPEESQVCAKCGAELKEAGAETTLSYAPPSGVEEEVEEVAYVEERPVLVVKKGPNVGQRFPLEKDDLNLGRDPQSDIFLNDITVSRKHARITIRGSKAVIADVGSLNGTYVNQERVEEKVLNHGDELQIGKFKLVFLGKRG